MKITVAVLAVGLRGMVSIKSIQEGINVLLDCGMVASWHAEILNEDINATKLGGDAFILAEMDIACCFTDAS